MWYIVRLDSSRVATLDKVRSATLVSSDDPTRVKSNYIPVKTTILRQIERCPCDGSVLLVHNTSVVYSGMSVLNDHLSIIYQWKVIIEWSIIEQYWRNTLGDNHSTMVWHQTKSAKSYAQASQLMILAERDFNIFWSYLALLRSNYIRFCEHSATFMLTQYH